MKNNCLFGVLKYFLSQNNDFKLVGAIKPILAQTKEGQNYFRIPFPIGEFDVSPYELIEAHLSIYEFIAPKKATLSPAHITAVFKLNNQQYRLHLFLDDNERIACDAHWDKIEEGEFVKSDKPEELDDFVYILLELGFPCLQQLRSKQREAVNVLTAEYEEKEVIAAKYSQNFDQHLTQYLTSIDAAQTIVKTLVTISNNIRWTSLNDYFNRLKIINNEAQKTIVVPEASEVEVLPIVVTQESKPKEKAKKEKQGSTTVAKANNSKFQHLLNLYNKLVGITDELEKISLIINFHRELNELILDSDQKLTPEEIKQLNDIERKLNKEAKIQLQSVLLKNDFSTAEKMRGFYSLVNYDIVNIALIKQDLKLLAFLITKMDFPIDTYPVVVKSVPYKNALQYCYLNELNEMMTLLVNHGVSLMQSLEPGGLPIAHLILSRVPRHPLMSVLEDSSETTLNNKCFYQQLINACRRYLGTQKPSLTDKNSIEQDLHFYEGQLTRVSLAQKLFLTPKTRQVGNESIDESRSMVDVELMNKLQRDPELLAMNIILQKKTKALVEASKIFSRQHLNKVFAFNYLIQQDLTVIQDYSLKYKLDPEKTFTELKTSALDYLKQVISLYDKMLRLIEVQSKLLTTPGFLNKKNNKLKGLIKEEARIIKEIQTESKILPQDPNNGQKELGNLADTLESIATSFSSMGKMCAQMTMFAEQLQRNSSNGAASSSSSSHDQEEKEKKEENCKMQ